MARCARTLFALFMLLFAPHAKAWNAAGHRLVAAIAWQQLSPASQKFVADALAAHPDHDRWVDKARTSDPADIFAEASTWPDDIRNDPRFHDEGRDDATPPLPGFADSARHKNWHYVDLDLRGRTKKGEVDRQIERLGRLLRSTPKKDDISYALPWLLHLVADIHQPLHVGHADDDGGNTVEIENPFNKRLPFSSLHTYWDDLPGPPWLRGQRLEKRVQRLIADYPAPPQRRCRAVAGRKPPTAPRDLPRCRRQPAADRQRDVQPAGTCHCRPPHRRRRLPPGLAARNEHQRARFT